MRGKPIHPDPSYLLQIAVACFILAILTFAVWLSVGCASSTTGRALNVGVVASAGLDLRSQQQVQAERRGREGNVLMGQTALQQFLVKAVGVTVVLAGSQAIEQQHPIWAHLARGIVIAGWTAASWHNYTMKGTR